MGHGQKHKGKKPAYGSPFGPGAKLQIRAVGHAFEHNAIAWVESYRDTKLGLYSEDVARMGQDMIFSPYDEEAETEKYALEEELYTSMSEWSPTIEQIRDLQDIRDDHLREFARVEMFHEWATPRREMNIEIRKRNLKNAEALKRIPREAKKAKDMYAKIFQEMEADMSEGAREIVRRTVVQRSITDDEGVEASIDMTYEQARERWDFIWILEAALNGLVKRGANVDDIHEMHARKEDFRKRIKDFKQGTMEWNAYCIALKRHWENAELLGIEIEEAEKVSILLQNVNQDIFKHQLIAYHDPNQRKILGYFNSYESLIEALDAVLGQPRMRLLFEHKDARERKLLLSLKRSLVNRRMPSHHATSVGHGASTSTSLEIVP